MLFNFVQTFEMLSLGSCYIRVDFVVPAFLLSCFLAC